MSYLYEKSKQPQKDINVNTTRPIDDQCLHDDSLFAESHDQVMNCELQRWDIKPDICLPLKQELTPGLSLKSELSASTLHLVSQHDQQYQDNKTIVSRQHQEYKADLYMAFPKEYNGLQFFQ